MKAKMAYVALLALAVIGTSVGVAQLPVVKAANPQAAAVIPAQAGTAQVQTLPDFAAIAEANKGAVVNITATATAKPASTPRIPPELEGTPFAVVFPSQFDEGEEELTAFRHIFVSQNAHWLPIADDLPQHAERPPERERLPRR